MVAVDPCTMSRSKRSACLTIGKRYKVTGEEHDGRNDLFAIEDDKGDQHYFETSFLVESKILNKLFRKWAKERGYKK